MAAGGAVRKGVLYGALALTLAATAWEASRDEPALDTAPLRSTAAAQTGPNGTSDAETAAPPATEAAASPQTDGGTADIDLARLQRAARTTAEKAADAFARHSWYVPPPPPKPAPPPKPVAPPLPFKYMGRLVEAGKEVVFLTGAQDRNYAVSAGDTITGTYRVESITESQMTFTYLPLGQRQTLQLAVHQ